MLTFIRALFSTTSKFAPKITGRIAFRLFCTTSKADSKSPKRQAILANARQQFAQAIRHTVTYSGGSIAAFEFEPATTASSNVSTEDGQLSAQSSNKAQSVLLVHGWQSHSAFMGNFVKPLQQRGFRVIAIDLPGHGQSSGRLFHIPLAVEAICVTQEKLGACDLVISHSLGGAVIATAMAGTIPAFDAVPASALVLISSPSSMPKIFNDFSAMVGLNKKANSALHQNVTRLSGCVTEDFIVAKQLQSVDVDVLLMHAPDDKEVPFGESESIANNNNRAVLKPMDGLGHRRIIADDIVVANAVEFVSNNRKA